MFGGLFFYMFLAECSNATVVKVSREVISVSHGPLPLRRSKSANSSDVVGLSDIARLRLVTGMLGTYRYLLVALLTNGRVMFLLSDVGSSEKADYIRGVIASFLELDPVMENGRERLHDRTRDFGTKRPRYTFRVKTARVKIWTVLIAILLFGGYLLWCEGIDPEPGINRGPLLIAVAGFLAILLIMWIYGWRRVFGFEWRLYTDGLEIVRKARFLNFIPWEEIVRFTSDSVIITRDGSKYPITLPPDLEGEMRQRIREIMRERGMTL